MTQLRIAVRDASECTIYTFYLKTGLLSNSRYRVTIYTDNKKAIRAAYAGIIGQLHDKLSVDDAVIISRIYHEIGFYKLSYIKLVTVNESNVSHIRHITGIRVREIIAHKYLLSRSGQVCITFDNDVMMANGLRDAKAIAHIVEVVSQLYTYYIGISVKPKVHVICDTKKYILLDNHGELKTIYDGEYVTHNIFK